MSSNETNSTQILNYDWVDEILHLLDVLKVGKIVIAISGTLLNAWFLLAMLTSRDIRSRLRNKIICSTFVVHLLDSALVIPVKVSIYFSKHQISCGIYSAVDNLNLIQDFIANWLVVMLLVVFIAQIQDFNPASRLTSKAVTVSTIGLLVLPWAASVMVVPIIVHGYLQRDQWTRDDCFQPSIDSYQVFKSVDTTIPILLSVLLLIVAAVLRYRRFTQRSLSDSIESELISGESQIDNIFAYVVAVIVFTLCDLLLMILACGVRKTALYGLDTWYKMSFSAVAFSDVRCVFMTLPWLLLPDVRQRIKTWRPWYCPAPGIDIIMTYRKEEN